MKFWLATFLVFIGCHFVHGQSKLGEELLNTESYSGKIEYYSKTFIEPDSIKKILLVETNDELRLELLLIYLNKQFLIDISFGKKEAFQALNLARQINKPLHETLALGGLSTIYSLNVNHDSTFYYADLALESAKKINDPVLISSIYYTTSLAHQFREQTTEEIKKLLVSIDYLEKSNNKNLLYSRLLVLGEKALSFSNYKFARNILERIEVDELQEANKHKYYTTWANYYKRTNNFDSVLIILKNALQHTQHQSIFNNLGDYFYSVANLDSAQRYFHKTIKLKNPKDSYFDKIYRNLSEIFEIKNNYDSAEYYLLRCNEEAERLKEINSKAKYNVLLAKFYIRREQVDKALYYAERSFEISTENNFLTYIEQSSEILSQLALLNNNYKEAFNFQKIAITAKDNLGQIEIAQLLNNAEVEQSLQKWVLEKDSEISGAKQTMHVALMFTFVLVLIIVLLIIMFRNKHKALATQQKLTKKVNEQNEEIKSQQEELVSKNRELFKSNSALEDSVRERTFALGKASEQLSDYTSRLEEYANLTAHNLRAPIANIKGLIFLLENQEKYGAQKEQIIGYIKNSSNELDDVLIELTELLQVENLKNLKPELVDIRQIVKDAQDHNFKKHGEGSEVVFDLNIIKFYTVPEFLVSIMRELLINAFTFRKNDVASKVTISVNEIKDNIVIEIKDNGQGMDMDQTKGKLFKLHQRFHKTVNGRGVGLYLVKRQVNALEGKIDVESDLGKGAKFTIKLKKRT